MLCCLSSSFFRSLLLDLNPYGGNDPDVMFQLFYKQVARELAPKSAVIFRHLANGGSFPVYWRLADVVPVPEESFSSDVEDHRLISITPFLKKIFEKFEAGKLSHYFESTSLLPHSQFSYRRGLGTCDALLTLSLHLRMALDGGMEGILVQLGFPAAFDRVSHHGLLCKLRPIGVKGQFLLIITEFLIDRRQRVLLDGKVSESVDVVSGVPQSSVLRP